MLWGFSQNTTLEFYGLRAILATLGISSLLSPRKLIHQGPHCTMSTPIPPAHQEKPVLGVGGWGQSPQPAQLHSLLWPLYNSGAPLGQFAGQAGATGNCLASLAWSCPSRSDLVPCVSKGMPGWLGTENTCGKFLSEHRQAQVTVTTTVLCTVRAGKLLRNQRRLEKRVGIIAQITVLLLPLLHPSDL